MSADSPATKSHLLVFRWPERSASFVLPSLFLASVAAHALAFYVFQVIYPAPSVSPPSAQITFLAPSSPESKELLRWVSARDPAAAEILQEVVPPGLGEISYTPSYAKAQSLPKPVEAAEESIPFPPARDSLALMAPASPRVASPHQGVQSSVAFSESLRKRDAAPQPEIVFAGKSSTSLKPAKFLVGIDDRGAVRFAFLQEEGSGDTDIDKEAEEQLDLLRFKSTEANAPLNWGFVTFTCGADAFAPVPPPTPQPSTEN
jgi:hypothetical protein